MSTFDGIVAGKCDNELANIFTDLDRRIPSYSNRLLSSQCIVSSSAGMFSQPCPFRSSSGTGILEVSFRLLFFDYS
jgi:hypothetical protein